MALQSFQLRFCLGQFRFNQHLWRSEDTRRRPTDGPLYRNEFALRGSMGKSPRHIVRVACLIKANMPQRVTPYLKSASTKRRSVIQKFAAHLLPRCYLWGAPKL